MSMRMEVASTEEDEEGQESSDKCTETDEPAETIDADEERVGITTGLAGSELLRTMC